MMAFNSPIDLQIDDYESSSREEEDEISKKSLYSSSSELQENFIRDVG